jgi:hypothetical protein
MGGFLASIGSSMRLFMRSENNLATNPDGIVKSPFNVIPAKAGIQKRLKTG